MRVDLQAVECKSAFAIASERAPGGRPTSIADGQLGIVALPDVLFLPHALDRGQSICLAARRFVPVEAILDCWNVGFFKDRWSRSDPRPYAGDFQVATNDAEVCILGNLFSRNFGHWTEELLKVAVLERAGANCRYVVPTLPAFARASLSFLGIEDQRVMVVDAPTLFARTLFSTAVSHENLVKHPIALTWLRDLVASRLKGSAARTGKRIWLERGDMVRNGGLVANPKAVHALLARHGFEAVDMATLPFRDQVAMVGTAQVVAGVHGSQFVHVQFMPPKSTVIECFSPMYVNPSVMQICRVLGHSYRQVVSRCNMVAPYALGRDCLVDCEHLEMVLDSLPG